MLVAGGFNFLWPVSSGFPGSQPINVSVSGIIPMLGSHFHETSVIFREPFPLIYVYIYIYHFIYLNMILQNKYVKHIHIPVDVWR